MSPRVVPKLMRPEHAAARLEIPVAEVMRMIEQHQVAVVFAPSARIPTSEVARLERERDAKVQREALAIARQPAAFAGQLDELESWLGSMLRRGATGPELDAHFAKREALLEALAVASLRAERRDCLKRGQRARVKKIDEDLALFGYGTGRA